METLLLEITNCRNTHSECNLRNTGFSQLNGGELWEIQTRYEGNLSKLFYFEKIIESLVENNVLIYIYHLLELDKAELDIIVNQQFSGGGIVSYRKYENDKYLICYKFISTKGCAQFFQDNFMNFVNVNNGIWINEKPTLNLMKNVCNTKLEDNYNLVNVNDCYFEVGYDADNLRIFFNNKKNAQTFISKMKYHFNVTVEEIEYVNCKVNKL